MLPERMQMAPDRLEFHLRNWAAWMGRGGAVMGCEATSAGFIGGGYNNDFDSMCEYADYVAARAVDTLVDGLPIPEHVAIYHRYLAAVWHGRDLEGALERAKQNLRNGLRVRGFY